MPDDKGIVCRPRPWWPGSVVPLVAFGFAWLMGWGPFVAIGAFVAASIIVAFVRPRTPGRWTE